MNNKDEIKEERIAIKDYSFNPKNLSIEPGIKVFWDNEDPEPHTVVSDPEGELFASEVIDTGESYSFLFETPGEYDYHCSIHPAMRGKIIVEE